MILALCALASLVLWIVLAFVLAIPSGWVHLPLAVGTVLIAAAIIKSGKGGRVKTREE